MKYLKFNVNIKQDRSKLVSFYLKEDNLYLGEIFWSRIKRQYILAISRDIGLISQWNTKIISELEEYMRNLNREALEVKYV